MVMDIGYGFQAWVSEMGSTYGFRADGPQLWVPGLDPKVPRHISRFSWSIFNFLSNTFIGIIDNC